MTNMQKWLVGVDEAGRGPLAGPVAVGAAQVGCDFDWALVPGVNDSKQLSEGKREQIFDLARRLKAAGQLNYAVAMVSAFVIDRIGIVPAIKRAQGRALLRLDLAPEHCHLKLDGGLKAPETFVYQETIIKGDSKERVIGLASILAKVTRDRYMRRIAQRYTNYDFATHKGYGTKAHREAIMQHGMCSEHRNTFCRILLKR